MHLWPFIPQQTFSETLEWWTDVITSKSNEQRLALRAVPRQGYELEFLLDPHQLSRAKALMAGAGYQDFIVPLWADLSRVGPLVTGASVIALDTTTIDVAAGDKILVWQEDFTYDLLDVVAVTSGSIETVTPVTADYSSAIVVPTRNCKVVQAFESSRGQGLTAKVKIGFEVVETRDLSDASAYTIYRGHAVMRDQPIISGGPMQSNIRWNVERVDSELGQVFMDPVRAYAEHTATAAWETQNRGELRALKGWLHSLKGKHKGFWMPSWNADLELLVPVSSGATTLTVKSVGYNGLYSTKDLAIFTHTGECLNVRVTGATDPVAGVEVLALAAPTSFSLSLSNVRMVCFLSYMRQDSDRVEIQHMAAGSARVVVPVIEVPAP